MKNTKTIGLIIGALLVVLLVWQLFFQDGGILQTGYNAVANRINTTWQQITGDSSNSNKILPLWGDDVDYDGGDGGLDGGTW